MMKNPPIVSDIEYVFLPEAERASETPLKEYIKILWKRKWLVIAPAFLIVPIVLLLLVIQKPTYEAVATLMIEDVNPRVISIQEVLVPERSPGFYKTQYQLIKIRAVVEEVVDTLQLDKKLPAETLYIEKVVQSIQRFPQRLIDNVFTTLRNTISETDPVNSAGSHTSNSRRQKAIRKLQSALKITPREGTKLVDISLQGDDPVEVTEQVNMVAAVYIRDNLENKLDVSRKAVYSLKKEAESLKERVRKAEADLQKFKGEKKLLISEDGGEKQNTSYQQLEVLHTSYAQTNASRLVLQTRMNELKKIGKNNLEESLDFSELSDNPAIRFLKTRYFDLKSQYVTSSSKYKYKHPEMIRIKNEIDDISENVIAEVKRIIRGLEKEYQATIAKDSALAAAVNAQKGEVLSLGKDITTYNELKHNVEVEKELYLAVSKRLAENTLTETLVTNNINAVESALVPEQPLPSWKILKLMLSCILGLACGAGLAIVVEHRDKRLKAVAEVERDLELPFLGFIPHYKIARGREYKLIALQEPASLAAESYRMLRTLLQSSPQAVQTLLVTSVTPAEGKTTTAANLAISFAQLGKTVLLVDADLRHPSLHHLFAGEGNVGLSDILLSSIDWRAGLQETPMENLKVILAGAKPPNPSELLSSRRMQALLKSWKEYFDIIIIDSPIVLAVPDVAVMAPVIDGLLLVHYPVKGDKELLREAKKLLEKVGARCIGMIFNNIKPQHEQYSAVRYGSPYKSEAAKLPTGRWGSTDFIDMRPIESRKQWQIEPAMTQTGTMTTPVEVGKSAQSMGLNITLKGFLVQQRLAEIRSTDGFAFLTLDLEIYNSAQHPHIFDPTLTTITVNWQDVYSQALASLITLPALDTAGASQRSRVAEYRCDPNMQTIARGIADIETIRPKHLKSGRLVYQVPEEVTNYLFGYEHNEVSIAISFSKHPSS